MDIFREPSNRVRLLSCNHSAYEPNNLKHGKLQLMLLTLGSQGTAAMLVFRLDSGYSEAS